MNDEEKKSAYIHWCTICLLAENMKKCETCPFNIGLEERKKVLESLKNKGS